MGNYKTEKNKLYKSMKKKMNLLGKIGIITFLVIIVACSNGQNNTEKTLEKNSEWTENVIPDFEIEFPKTDFKVEKTESRNPELGNILVTNWILQGKDENGPFMYFVATNEFPQELKDIEDTEPNSLNIAFQAMLTSSAVKLGGTDFEFTEIKYKDFKGMESICKVFNGAGIIKSRVYKIDNNLFIISAGGQKISIESVNNFLNSFGLKK